MGFYKAVAHTTLANVKLKEYQKWVSVGNSTWIHMLGNRIGCANNTGTHTHRYSFV